MNVMFNNIKHGEMYIFFSCKVLQGLRACADDLVVLQGRAQVEEGQSIVAAWQESGLIVQVFPLHETSALTQLQQSWVRKMFAPQPLGNIHLIFD